MKRILALLLCLITSNVHAQQTVELCQNVTVGTTTTCQPLSSANPMHIGGTISATNIIVGTTTISGGTNTYILYNNNGVLGNEQAVPVANGGTNAVTPSGALDNLFISSSTASNPLSFNRYYSVNSTSSSYVAQNTYGQNIDPAKLTKLRSCLAKVRSGSGRCTFVRVGDSTTIGINSSNVANWPNEGTYLASYLTSVGIPAYQDGWSGLSTGSGNGNRPSADPRFTMGSWTNKAQTTLGGSLLGSSASGAAFVFTPYNNVDTCKVFYFDYNQAGTTATLQAGGGSTVNIDETTSSGFKTATATTTLGANACTINYTGDGSHTVFIESMVAYDSSQAAIDIIDAGWWGTKLNDWVAIGSSYSSLNFIAALKPDAVILKTGINDASAATPLSTYAAQLNTFITTISANTDTVLEQDNPTSANLQAPYLDALYAASITNNVPIVDSYSIWGTYALAGAQGYMSDTQHPLTQGYADMATREASAIFSVSPGGGSLPSATAPIVFSINNSEKARIATNGNVGIGTSIPSTAFQVIGTATATGFSGPLTGNVTGNVSGTSATVTGATQAAITSAVNLANVGTITSGIWNAGAVTSSGLITSPTFALSGAAYSGAAWTTTSPVWNMPATQFTNTTSSGTVSVQAEYTINAPTLLASSATTITSAATLYVAKPVASTNITITTPFSIYTPDTIFAGNGVTASTNGFSGPYLNLTSTTIPANGVYRPNTNTLGFSAGSALTMSMTTSGLAIGTTATISGSDLTLAGHLGFSTSIPTVTTCGGGALATGSTDNKGQITGISAATACTITFGTPLPAAPACSVTTSTGIVAWGTPSTTALTTTMALFTGTLAYICF